MAVARLMMQNWKREYNKILENSDIKEILAGIYVDDGRSMHRKLFYGERFYESLKKFEIDEDLAQIDIGTGMDRDELTRLEVQKAMNSVCDELNFTMELCQDFSDRRLPTLSFSLWLDRKGINHSYFEKTMRNQTLVVERSSMGRQALMSIMSNELVRRLEVLGELDQNEIDNIIDKYIQQLINSEYNWKQIREIVVSALTGYVRKVDRNKRTDKPRYRSDKQSLKNRVDKKLLEKLNWFKKCKKDIEVDNGEIKNENEKIRNRWRHYRRRKEPISSLDNENVKCEPPKAVLFVQSTPNSELAQEIRKVIQDLKPWTGINIKVVERAGDKLQDLLHKSNPWDILDCERVKCFICSSVCSDDKIAPKDCHKRSAVYETWCDICKNRNIEGANTVNPKVSEKRDREEDNIENSDYFKYIGETSRSCYERGLEHLKDLEFKRPKSHLLRHAIEEHPELDPDSIKFKMKILSFHKSAFERQIREAVLITEFAGPKLLNSKIEYNRSLIPQLSVKLGPNKSTSEDPEITKEKSVIEKIKLKYKSENKRQVEALETGKVTCEMGDSKKRMKFDETQDTETSPSEISPTSSNNTYNLCSSANPQDSDKFAHKFTLSPTVMSPNCSGGNITKPHCNKSENQISPNCGDGHITMPHCNKSENPEKGRHLWSIFDTQSQVEEIKDPNPIIKKTSKVESTVKSRRHLWSDKKSDTKSQMDKTKSPASIINRGKVKSLINGIENYKKSPVIKRKLIKKCSPTIVHKDRKKLKEKLNNKSPKSDKKKMEIKHLKPDRNPNKTKIERIIENFECNIQLKPEIDSNETSRIEELKVKKDAFKILMESPGYSVSKSSKFKKERRKKSCDSTPTRQKTRLLDDWLSK